MYNASVTHLTVWNRLCVSAFLCWLSLSVRNVHVQCIVNHECTAPTIRFFQFVHDEVPIVALATRIVHAYDILAQCNDQECDLKFQHHQVFTTHATRTSAHIMLLMCSNVIHLYLVEEPHTLDQCCS